MFPVRPVESPDGAVVAGWWKVTKEQYSTYKHTIELEKVQLALSSVSDRSIIHKIFTDLFLF